MLVTYILSILRLLTIAHKYNLNTEENMREFVQWLLDHKFQFDVRDYKSDTEFIVTTWNTSGNEFTITKANLDFDWNSLYE